MQAVIMAGGKGTRLSDLTKNEIPKPMVRLQGRPILEYQIEVLKENGIEEIYLIIGYLGEVIEKYFGDGSRWKVNVQYIREEEPLGTAGALYYLKKYIRGDFLFVFGDLIFDISVQRFLEFHKQKGALCSLFVHPNTHPYDSDVILTDETERVIGFLSKKEERQTDYHNLVNAGIYIMSPEICNQLMELKKMDLEKDVLFPMISDGKNIYAYRSAEYVKDVGTPERLRMAERDLEEEIVKKKNLNRKQRCIFLDRDGTINKYAGLLSRPEQLELETGVVKALKKLNQSEYLTIIVTNQPVVARGMCSIEELDEIHRKLETMLGREGVYVDKIVYCPHHPDSGYEGENRQYKVVCDCRKPKTGMIEQCVREYHIDLSKSWMIGDTTTDIKCGKNAGMKTVLVRTGIAGTDGKYDVKADLISENVYEAVLNITDADNQEGCLKV